MQIEWTSVEKLLAGSNYDEDQRDYIFERMLFLEDQEGEFYEEEFWLWILRLMNNQLDPITHGSNYQQRNILNHLKKLR